MFLKILDAVDKAIAVIAISVGWISLLTLMGLRVYEVVGRQFTIISPNQLRRYELLAFALMIVLSLGYAYAKNAHVRVDIFRARLGLRGQAWLEIIGGVVVVVPLAVIVAGLFYPFIAEIYLAGGRWWFGAIIPFGFGLLGLSGLVVIARNVLFLTGRTDRPAPADSMF